MTEPKPSRAEAKRPEAEWLGACRRQEEQLQALPDSNLDALVAGTVFNDPDLAGVPFSTSWDGFGRVVEHMQARGYTLLCNAFEPSHLEWMKQFPSHSAEGGYRPAEVTVVDIRRRLPLPETWPHFRVFADTLPRTAAIAAVLTRLMEQETIASPVSQSDPSPPKSAWTEERRRRQSEQMKAYWQRKHIAALGEQGAVRP